MNSLMAISKIMRDTAVCFHTFDMMSGSIKAYYSFGKRKSCKSSIRNILYSLHINIVILSCTLSTHT